MKVMKKLMWTAGLLDEKTRGRMKDLCEKHNADLLLSDRFLVFPLHVSFKRSFYTDDFTKVKDDLRVLLQNQKRIALGKSHLERVSDMIWLCFEDIDAIKALHERIDRFLKERYDVAIDTFDRNYHPHASIFRDKDEKKLDRMYERLLREWKEEETFIDAFFIGSKVDANEYFVLGTDDRIVV